MERALLSDITVVEIGDPLTEYAGLVLAGLGATVYLVEPPGGAATRERNPRVPGTDGDRSSIPFLARNSGKRSVSIDPGSAEGRELFVALLGRGNVVLQPPTSAFNELVERTDGATPVIRIVDPDGLGRSSIVGFAASGGLSSSGWPHQPPCNAPGWLAVDGTSVYAAIAAILAIRDPAGAPYEIRYRDAAIAAVTPWTRPLHSYGMSTAGQGASSGRLGSGPHPIFPCRDGYVRILAATPRQWSAWVELLGSPEALSDEAWNNPGFRAANFDAHFAIASELVADRGMNELFLKGQELGLTITPVLNIERFMEDPQVQARGFFVEVDDPEHGPMKLPRPPYRMGTDRPPAAILSPAPGLGQHNEEARAFIARPREDVTASASLATPSRPLDGIRVLDCGVGAVVPEAASLLALLGADVIKIESQRNLDFLRRIGLGGVGDFNNSPTFNQLNLGVRSIAVDMSTQEGRDVVAELVTRCDIVLENLRGGVMAKWGLDYESVRAIKPDIIYLSSQGLGSGPYDGFRTYGPNLQTFSGVTSLWAHPDDPYPVGTTLNHPDHFAGKQALVALLAALMRRESTGDGCHLDCTQFEAASYLLSDKFLEHQMAVEDPDPMGNRSEDFAPHGCYPVQGDDRWCALAVENDKQWERFAAAVEEPWCRRPEFRTQAGRLSAADELDALVASWTATRTGAEVVARLRNADVPASVVVTGDDMAADKSMHGDGLFECVTHPTAGPRWYVGLPLAGSEGRFPVRRAPLLGEHDQSVLVDLLGMPPAKVSALAESGAIGF